MATLQGSQPGGVCRAGRGSIPNLKLLSSFLPSGDGMRHGGVSNSGRMRRRSGWAEAGSSPHRWPRWENSGHTALPAMGPVAAAGFGECGQEEKTAPQRPCQQRHDIQNEEGPSFYVECVMFCSWSAPRPPTCRKGTCRGNGSGETMSFQVRLQGLGWRSPPDPTPPVLSTKGGELLIGKNARASPTQRS